MTRAASRAGDHEGEHGSATLFAVACLAVLLVVTLGAGVVTGAVLAHRRAQSAADLAALAGAATLTRGGDACAHARRIAEANVAGLSACRVEGADVVVEVGVEGPSWWWRSTLLTATARAGPARARVGPARARLAR